MALQLNLYGYATPDNARVTRILLAAEYAVVGVECHDVDALRAEDPELFRLNCHPLVAAGGPVLETPQGFLFESNAIVRYLARLGLAAGIYGVSDFEATMIDAWLDYCLSEIDPHAFTVLKMVNGYCERDDAAVADAHEAVMRGFDGLNGRLETLTFLVGERPTVADLTVFASVDMYLRFCGAEHAARVYDRYRHVVRHYMTVLHLPTVQTVLRRIEGHGGLIPAPPVTSEKSS